MYKRTNRLLSLLLVFLLLFTPLLILTAGAEAVFYPLQYNGHYYMVFKSDYSWEQAKAQCKKLGGYLAAITSKEENDFIAAQLTEFAYYIGGTDAQEEGVWTWVSGEPFVYTNFNSGEPNNGLGGFEEDCLAIYGDRNKGKWVDAAGNYENGFVCEWDGEPDLKTARFIPGDVNNDKRITAADARLALRAAVQLEHYASVSRPFLAADVNRSATIEAADARRILRAAVGLETLS